MQKSFLTGILVLLLTLSASSSFPHPHVWVDCELTAVFDSEGVAGFKQVWTFDSFFSVTMLDEIDADGNREIDETEARHAKANAFDNLKKFNYFTDIRINGKPFQVQFVKDFRCSVDAGKLVYEFFVPCHVLAAPADKTITIGIYDQSFYTDIGYINDSLQRAGQTSDLVIRTEPVELTDTFFETIMHSPGGFELRFRQK